MSSLPWGITYEMSRSALDDGGLAFFGLQAFVPKASVLAEPVEEAMDVGVRVEALHLSWIVVVYFIGYMRNSRSPGQKLRSWKLRFDLHFRVSLFRVFDREYDESSSSQSSTPPLVLRPPPGCATPIRGLGTSFRRVSLSLGRKTVTVRSTTPHSR